MTALATVLSILVRFICSALPMPHLVPQAWSALWAIVTLVRVTQKLTLWVVVIGLVAMLRWMLMLTGLLLACRVMMGRAVAMLTPVRPISFPLMTPVSTTQRFLVGSARVITMVAAILSQRALVQVMNLVARFP